jgi:uncharacterized protein with HEPN domain
MLSDSARFALLDIAENVRLAREFVSGVSLDVFKTDRLRFYAVTRALEIISEATRRLPAALHERHPELPWRAIMGVGNVYRHDYDNAEEEYVWRTVHQSLGPLLEAIVQEIEANVPKI